MESAALIQPGEPPSRGSLRPRDLSGAAENIVDTVGPRERIAPISRGYSPTAERWRQRFEGEPTDPNWAQRAEQALSEDLTRLHERASSENKKLWGTKVEDVECRATTCRVSFEWASLHGARHYWQMGLHIENYPRQDLGFRMNCRPHRVWESFGGHGAERIAPFSGAIIFDCAEPWVGPNPASHLPFALDRLRNPDLIDKLPPGEREAVQAWQETHRAEIDELRRRFNR